MVNRAKCTERPLIILNMKLKCMALKMYGFPKIETVTIAVRK